MIKIISWLYCSFIRYALYRCPRCYNHLWHGHCNCSGKWKMDKNKNTFDELMVKQFAEEMLYNIRAIHYYEKIVNPNGSHGRPEYNFQGKELEWNENISSENMELMAVKAEVFLLRNKDHIPYAFICRDSFGVIRERKIF